MSTNAFLHNSYNIHGFDLTATRWKDGNTYFHLRHTPRSLRCPECRSHGVRKNGTRSRTIRLPPIGRKQAFAVLDAQRNVRWIESIALKLRINLLVEFDKRDSIAYNTLV